jgi:hypothetical protein
MHLAKLTMTKFLPLLFVAIGFQTVAFSQENSPYSRYGLGDLSPNHNIFTRGMGGISAAVVDYQSINSANPASLSAIPNTIFDIGIEGDFRTLKNTNPAKKFTSANSLFSYLQLGFPLTTTKMRKKNIDWGMAFGLKPITKVNYKIAKFSRLSGIDSLYTLYEGTGGINQVFVGTGLKVKNLSLGINAGYMFGNKDYSTKLEFISDSVNYNYYKSNSQDVTTFGGLVVTGGVQYQIILNKDKKNAVPQILRFGAYGNIQQKLNAKRNIIRETFEFDQNSGTFRIDSVYQEKDVKGKIDYPSSFGLGVTYQNEHWLTGIDFETTSWNNYRYYGQTDAVQNNWIVRAGAQYYPAKAGTPVKKYFNFVRYRAGFFYGPDYIKTNNKRPEYGFTVGAGLPLTTLRYINYTGEFVMLNTALEIGGRGDKNANVKENMVRFSIGISMNARWFAKRKYN